MKKVLDRLRRWLINKLGGYTEPPAPIKQQIVRYTAAKTHKLTAKASIAMSPSRVIDFKRYCESQLLDRITWELYNSGFILWERQEDVFERKVNVQATVYVADANELTPYKPSYCWEE